MKSSGVLICCLFLLTKLCSLNAQTKVNKQAQTSPRSFVQDFYNWYVPKARGDNPGPAWGIAMKDKASFFAPELLRQLREDSDAQGKAEGDIVGVDFDPFLSAQDPCEHYEVGRVTQNAASYRIEIYGVCASKRREKPDVIVELTQEGEHWRFVNFYYPKDRNLLSILKVLRDNREKLTK